MTLAIDQLRLGQVTDAQGTLLAHERTMPASQASRWLQLTMETVLDLWHGRFAAAEARLFTVAAPIVARAHAERARVADTLQQTWQGQVFWLRRERGELLTRTDPEVFRQIEGHAFFAIWRVGLALASCDEGDLPAAAASPARARRGIPRLRRVPAARLDRVGRRAARRDVPGDEPRRPPAPARAADTDRADPLGELLPTLTARLRVILSRYAGEFVLAGWPSVLLGPAERFSGLLAMAAGEHRGGAAPVRRGRDGKVAGAPPQAARLQADKARALIRLARPNGGAAGLRAPRPACSPRPGRRRTAGMRGARRAGRRTARRVLTEAAWPRVRKSADACGTAAGGLTRQRRRSAPPGPSGRPRRTGRPRRGAAPPRGRPPRPGARRCPARDASARAGRRRHEPVASAALDVRVGVTEPAQVARVVRQPRYILA